MLLVPVPSNLSDSNQEGPQLLGSGELLSILFSQAKGPGDRRIMSQTS